MAKKNKRDKDGRIRTQITYSVNGEKFKKRLSARTHEELKNKETELRRKLGLKLDVSSEKDTFGVWCDRLLELKKNEIAATWYNSLKSCSKHLTLLHSIKIAEIKSFELQTLIYNLDLSQKTLKTIKSLISQVFQFAIENRVIEYNPAVNIKIPKKESQIERRALSEEERQWIIDTPHRCQLPAMIMMFAGLRRGEVIPLTWTDINLKENTININKSVIMIKGQSVVKTGGKTDSATRVVHIPQKLADFLALQKKEGINVCLSADGKMLSETAFKRLWESYMKEINFKYGNFSNIIDFELPKSRFAPVKIPQVIPPITPHWLRHTFASMLYMAGVDVLTAKEQLGHSDIKTTLNIYTHLDKTHKTKNINKLNDFLAKAK